MKKNPEVVEDYIRNFLFSRGLLKSLETFQNEWYEFKKRGNLSPEDDVIVEDVYIKNQTLTDNIQKLRSDIQEYKDIANKAQATFEKLKKERDFHRMHHQRVVQEKNKLITDMNRLKNKCAMFEPIIENIQKKYEIAMKEKMLTKLDRDKLAGKVVSLEATVKQMENWLKDIDDTQITNKKIQNENSMKGTTANAQAAAKISNGVTLVSTNALNMIGATTTSTTTMASAHPRRGTHTNTSSGPRESIIPAGTRLNPYANLEIQPSDINSMNQIQNIKAHEAAISSIKLHPKKKILATVSDDKYWKMWSFPNGELIMSGTGHSDWIADCDFHPKGGQLATASGDGTIKIWDFLKGQAISTLSEHTQAVWGCAFHDLGEFLVSCSMDHTAKLWDIHTEKCKHTFRGHSDSVNNVGFQPYSNIMYTCSGDKSVMLWDIRTGMCVQTLLGHQNSINCTNFSIKGNSLASCDADGIVKLWDIRTNNELNTINFGPHAANKLVFDPSGTILAVASNDGSCKFYNCNTKSRISSIESKEESMQSVLFDYSGEFLITAGSEGFFQVYK